MILRHSAALALVGWYLMGPPLTSPGSEKHDTQAPLSRWRMLAGFRRRSRMHSTPNATYERCRNRFLVTSGTAKPWNNHQGIRRRQITSFRRDRCGPLRLQRRSASERKLGHPALQLRTLSPDLGRCQASASHCSRREHILTEVLLNRNPPDDHHA
jgi:hypothetical protein